LSSGEQFAGDYEFDVGFESQKKVAKSVPWTVSVSFAHQVLLVTSRLQERLQLDNISI